MNLDGQTLGNILTILQICAIVGGFVYFSARMENKIVLLANAHQSFIQRLDKVDSKLDGLTVVTTQIARQEERMVAQDQRMQEISNRLDTAKFVGQFDSSRSRSRPSRGRSKD